MNVSLRVSKSLNFTACHWCRPIKINESKWTERKNKRTQAIEIISSATSICPVTCLSTHKKTDHILYIEL